MVPVLGFEPLRRVVHDLEEQSGHDVRGGERTAGMSGASGVDHLYDMPAQGGRPLLQLLNAFFIYGIQSKAPRDGVSSL